MISESYFHIQGYLLSLQIRAYHDIYKLINYDDWLYQFPE